MISHLNEYPVTLIFKEIDSDDSILTDDRLFGGMQVITAQL